MAGFVELTESQQSQKILLNLEEVTFIQVGEKKQSKTTIVHLTSSTYGADRSIMVMEDYETVKGFVIKTGLLLEK